MRRVFTVTQNDNTESYSERFNVGNEELNISISNYDLHKAIREFLQAFEEEYRYLCSINDSDLNKEALTKKEKFGQYNNLYKEVTK